MASCFFMKTHWFLLIALLTACHMTTSREPSSEMSHIIEGRRLGKWDLRVSDLPQGEEPRWTGREEVFWLPMRPHTEDAFRYRVILDRRQRKYWIERFGGIA